MNPSTPGHMLLIRDKFDEIYKGYLTRRLINNLYTNIKTGILMKSPPKKKVEMN